MKRFLLMVMTVLLFNITSDAQRYLTETFDEVQVTSTAYGFNYTVLLVPQIGRTFRQPLATDVYRPVGDTETKRPLIIYFPTGNFLPFPQNTSVSGTIKDSTSVEFATRLTKMGYVVAIADYRKGWNPVATTQEARVNTLINAAYRGVQDARTAIRFFKAQADAFGIDTTRIAIWGQGTGGYITLATATLDSYSKVFSTTNPAFKFIGSNQLPFVIERFPLPGGGFWYINADIEGKITGRVPPNQDGTPNPGPPPTGDTLNEPNWVNHSSDFKLAIQMGGALGDISWLDENSKNIISIQAPYDPFAPYEDGVLFVQIPGGQLPVVQVQGGLLVQRKLRQLGFQEEYENIKPEYDPIGQAIKGKQDGLVNLFPIYGTAANIPGDSSPWDFWSPDNVNNANGLLSNPDMSPEKARRYIDSIITFVAPRACIGLDLPCKELVVSSVKDLTDTDVQLNMSPNPAATFVNISVNETTPIKSISVFDITGRNMRTFSNINQSTYQLQRGDLKDGIYIIQMSFEKGVLSKKVIFD
ncbi:MAG: T9SS type A sorting domain-containing protein [Saprospiraceae bacterium]|nr:T9SS type A sorting domain-containing protein [Saprospiraceae bacterium]